MYSREDNEKASRFTICPENSEPVHELCIFMWCNRCLIGPFSYSMNKVVLFGGNGKLLWVLGE